MPVLQETVFCAGLHQCNQHAEKQPFIHFFDSVRVLRLESDVFYRQLENGSGRPVLHGAALLSGILPQDQRRQPVGMMLPVTGGAVAHHLPSGKPLPVGR